MKRLAHEIQCGDHTTVWVSYGYNVVYFYESYAAFEMGRPGTQVGLGHLFRKLGITREDCEQALAWVRAQSVEGDVQPELGVTE